MLVPFAAAQSFPLKVVVPLTRPATAAWVDATVPVGTEKLSVLPATRVIVPTVKAIAAVRLMWFAFELTVTAPKDWAKVPVISNVPPLP